MSVSIEVKSGPTQVKLSIVPSKMQRELWLFLNETDDHSYEAAFLQNFSE